VRIGIMQVDIHFMLFRRRKLATATATATTTTTYVL
jgi:hypothetical protein